MGVGLIGAFVKKLFDGEPGGNGEDLGARGHDVADDLVAKFDGRTNQVAVGLFENALFLASLEQRVHGFGGIFFCLVARRFGEGGNREQEAEGQSDGKDEVEEQAQEAAEAHATEATGTGEEDKGQKAVEEDDDQHGAEDILTDLGGRGASERVADKNDGAEDHRQAGERKLHQHSGREGDVFAAHAQARLEMLFPGVDVLLKLTGEELAHLGVHAVDVRGQGENDEQNDGDQCRDERHRTGLRRAGFLAARPLTGTAGPPLRSGRDDNFAVALGVDLRG
jgi:hypothetical protein